MSNIPIHERRNWLGASEVAALFGASPFTTRFELWHQKAGNIPPHDLDGDERVNAGRFLEPAIAAWASDKWEWPLANVREYLSHPKVSRMGASLDFEVTGDGEPVEIKNVDNLIFRDGEWETDGDVIVDAPMHYLIQVQHQLACRPDAGRGWLIPCVGGNRLYRMEVPRHDGLIRRIETEVAGFWESIEANRPPEPDFDTDAAAISQLYGGNGNEVIDLSDDERMRALCLAYKAAGEQEKAARKAKSAALAEIKTLMQDARCAFGPEGFCVKASHIKEGTSTRQAHWRFSVNQRKQESAQ
ncbi:MAG: YqaJ viral recombinase family protein [Salinisphaeraceae bacterium]